MGGVIAKDSINVPGYSLSQHIYGISRRGKRIGGGIKKIRKICEKRGISL